MPSIALLVELGRLGLKLYRQLKVPHQNVRSLASSHESPHKAHLFTALGLLQPVRNFFTGQMRSLGIVRVLTRRLQAAVLSRFGSEVGWIVALGGVGEDVEGYSRSAHGSAMLRVLGELRCKARSSQRARRTSGRSTTRGTAPRWTCLWRRRVAEVRQCALERQAHIVLDCQTCLLCICCLMGNVKNQNCSNAGVLLRRVAHEHAHGTQGSGRAGSR